MKALEWDERDLRQAKEILRKAPAYLLRAARQPTEARRRADLQISADSSVNLLRNGCQAGGRGSRVGPSSAVCSKGTSGSKACARSGGNCRVPTSTKSLDLGDEMPATQVCVLDTSYCLAQRYDR